MAQTSRIVGWLSSLFVSFLARLILALRITPSFETWGDDLVNQLMVELSNRGMHRGRIAELFACSTETVRMRAKKHGDLNTRAGSVQPLAPWRVTALNRLRESNGAWISVEDLRTSKRVNLSYDCWFNAMIKDLVDAGVLEVNASGLTCRVVCEERLQAVQGTPSSREAEESLVWAAIYRRGPISEADLSPLVAMPGNALRTHLRSLIRQGLVTDIGESDDAYIATHFEASPIEAQRWESALHDHFAAVYDAAAAKLVHGGSEQWTGVLGGSTYSFDLWEGHPDEQRVRELLSTLRAVVRPVVDEHREHDRALASTVPRAEVYRVVVYLGQGVVPQGEVPGGGEG